MTFFVVVTSIFLNLPKYFSDFFIAFLEFPNFSDLWDIFLNLPTFLTVQLRAASNQELPAKNVKKNAKSID